MSQAGAWGWTVGHAGKCPRAGGEVRGEGLEGMSPVLGLQERYRDGKAGPRRRQRQ